ncbi:MAG TPA: glucose 1-dehydrogenase [Gemmatimonadaceae bacterium]|nr:glucose 1-dehydrogenase [Gemmatimonadaceae bacterium]
MNYPTFLDKVVLITGGSSGIGRAAALAFAREGARVVLAARGAERGEGVAHEIAAAGGRAEFVRADVSKAAEVEALVQRAASAYGRLDCAFNNAATTDGVFASTADFDEDAFDRAIAATLKSVWLCMKYEIRQMLAQQPAGGAIVNTSSVNGLGGAPGGALYSAAKAGVLALTKSAAWEYAAQGVRVNALVAGAFRTPMLEHVLDRASGGHPEQAEPLYTQRIALARLGRPEEAAAAALWLCSDEASYVTGHSMIVDGGMTAPVR